MSWLYSAALVAEYLGENFLDGEQSVQSNGKPTQQAYCAPDKMTAFSRLSRFGMTFKPLMENLGEELLMSFRAGFHAKTSQPLEKGQELTEKPPECGEKWHGSFTKYNPDSSSWKTHQCLLLGDLEEFSETWPQWGLMRNGECWEQKTLEQNIRGTEFGLSLLPTPTASMMPCEGTVRIMRKAWESGEFTLEEALAVARRDVRKSQGKVPMWPTPVKSESNGSAAFKLTDAVEASLGKTMPKMQKNPHKWEEFRTWPTPVCQDSRHATTRHLDPKNNYWKSNLGEVVMSLEQPNTGGRLNPTWVEWLMGWPLGWTDLKPLEMDKSHFVPQQHGESSQKDN